MQAAKKFGRRYPWALWFKRGKFALIRGRDFDCLVHGMAQMVRNVARSRRLRVSVHQMSDDRIEVLVIGALQRKNGSR